LKIERADALNWMARAAPAQFELVLLDPPFDAELEAVAVQVAEPLVAEGGYLYLESAAGLGVELPGLSLHRSLQAGAVCAQLYRRPAAQAQSA
jgi:16S rRNA G966 N2-methylase RsmD